MHCTGTVLTTKFLMLFTAIHGFKKLGICVHNAVCTYIFVFHVMQNIFPKTEENPFFKFQITTSSLTTMQCGYSFDNVHFICAFRRVQ